MLRHHDRLKLAVLIKSLPGEGFRPSHHVCCAAHPAHDCLVVDAHRQRVVAAQFGVLPPVHLRLAVEEIAANAALHRKQLAEEAFSDESLNGRIGKQRNRRWHDLGNQPRLGQTGVEHAPSLRGVHRHARLGKHVFAGADCSQCHRTMQIRPGTDNNGVRVRIGDRLLPVPVCFRDAETLGHGGRRRLTTVGHADDFHAIDRL